MSAPNQAKPVSRERIGRYEVIRKIATGGMAELFLAKQVGMEGFERVVAIKRILAHLAFDEEFINMFRDEARIVAKLSHPNIVQIFDLVKSGDSYFIAMEYIPGRNLATVAKRARQLGEGMPPLYVARCLAQACEGLHYAHTREDLDGAALGIVHRDVSPQNIIVSFSGGVKLVDFGIAKAATKIAHTRAGVLKGKYAYMSPEQIRGENIDARSDLFSAGIVLFELLTGQRPFEKDSSIQTLKAIVQDPHPDCRAMNPAIPEAVAKVIDRALEKQRDRRFQSAQELQLALEDAVAAGEDRVNSLSIANWMKRLFEAELKKSSGHTMVVKGVGEVILPPSDEPVAEDVALESSAGFSEEGTEESAANRKAPDLGVVPRQTSGAGRGHLIEEGVIAHVPSTPPDAAFPDDHTELAPESLAGPAKPNITPAPVIETSEVSDPAELTGKSFNASDEETFESREEVSAIPEPTADEPPLPLGQPVRTDFSDIAERLLEVSEDEVDPWGDKTSADPHTELPPPLDETIGQPVILDRSPPGHRRPVAVELSDEPTSGADDPWGDRTAAEPTQGVPPTDELPAIDSSHSDPTLPPNRGLPVDELLAGARVGDAAGDRAERASIDSTDGEGQLLALAFADEHETLSATANSARSTIDPEVDTLDPRDALDLDLDAGSREPEVLSDDDDDGPALPEAAKAGLDRDIDRDSATIAGMGLLESGFPEDEQTVGVTEAPASTEDSEDGSRQRLASIRLEKRGPVAAAKEERARPNAHIELELDEDEPPRRNSLDFEHEELTAPADPAMGTEPALPEPRIDSISPPPRRSDPAMAAAFSELGSPEELFRPREPDAMGPPDPYAALGSTRVPAGSLSLSDLLTDERRSSYGMGLVSKPPAQGHGMVAPGGAPPRALSSPPIPNPPSGASAGNAAPGRAPLRNVSLRNIRETSRAGPASIPPAPAPVVTAPPVVPNPGPMMVIGPEGQPVPAYGGFVPQPAPYRPSDSSRALQWVLVFLTVVVLSIVIGVGYFAYVGTRLTIETVPPGARVSINGHPVEGLTPLEVRRLRPGSTYQVLIEKEGHADYLGVVSFPENSRDARVSFPLEPLKTE